MKATGYPHTLRPELHKALMARGIDYWVAQGLTFWNRDDGCECLAYGYQVDAMPRLAIKVVGFTDPEHAIAAAMGDADLAAENAKLRELVLELWRSCPVSVSDCKMCMCPHYIEESEGDWCDISIRIDELGIEGTNDRDREGQAHRANPRDRRDP